MRHRGYLTVASTTTFRMYDKLLRLAMVRMDLGHGSYERPLYLRFSKQHMGLKKRKKYSSKAILALQTNPSASTVPP